MAQIDDQSSGCLAVRSAFPAGYVEAQTVPPRYRAAAAPPYVHLPQSEILRAHLVGRGEHRVACRVDGCSKIVCWLPVTSPARAFTAVVL